MTENNVRAATAAVALTLVSAATAQRIVTLPQPDPARSYTFAKIAVDSAGETRIAAISSASAGMRAEMFSISAGAAATATVTRLLAPPTLFGQARNRFGAQAITADGTVVVGVDFTTREVLSWDVSATITGPVMGAVVSAQLGDFGSVAEAGRLRDGTLMFSASTCFGGVRSFCNPLFWTESAGVSGLLDRQGSFTQGRVTSASPSAAVGVTGAAPNERPAVWFLNDVPPLSAWDFAAGTTDTLVLGGASGSGTSFCGSINGIAAAFVRSDGNQARPLQDPNGSPLGVSFSTGGTAVTDGDTVYGTDGSTAWIWHPSFGSPRVRTLEAHLTSLGVVAPPAIATVLQAQTRNGSDHLLVSGPLVLGASPTQHLISIPSMQRPSSEGPGRTTYGQADPGSSQTLPELQVYGSLAVGSTTAIRGRGFTPGLFGDVVVLAVSGARATTPQPLGIDIDFAQWIGTAQRPIRATGADGSASTTFTLPLTSVTTGQTFNLQCIGFEPTGQIVMTPAVEIVIQ